MTGYVLLAVVFISKIMYCRGEHGDLKILDRIASRPSRCPSACQKYGTCNEELSRCDCPKGRKGSSCHELLSTEELSALCSQMGFEGMQPCLADVQCLNRCNNRGTCVQGFCHCFPGHFGTDCSLSLDDSGQTQILAGAGYVTRAKRPWVYVYELPLEYNAWQQRTRVDRPTFFLFWQRFLSSGARTADPDKADLFFIPVYMRHLSDHYKLKRVVGYIASHWPYMNHTGGMSKHIVIHGGDWGKKELRRFNDRIEGLPDGILGGLTWLTHWGVHRHVYLSYEQSLGGPRSGLVWEPAHKPGKDVVVPVPVAGTAAYGHDMSPLHPRFTNPPDRNVTFFHAGRVCGDAPPDTSKPWPFNCGPRGRMYSAGVRQRVHSYHHNRTGYEILLRTKNLGMKLKTSKFCLATQGGGHGNRQTIAAVSGCVPVIIGDNVYQPFEPELDWNSFGIRVEEKNIPILHTILASMDNETYKQKQAALRCGAQHLIFSSMRGALIGESGHFDIFETTLEILRAHIDHPGVAPNDLKKVDPELKRFMACGADEIGQEPPPLRPGTPRVCSRSRLDSNTLESCNKCAYKHMTGGAHALCCNSPNLAACPRLWH